VVFRGEDGYARGWGIPSREGEAWLGGESQKKKALKIKKAHPGKATPPASFRGQATKSPLRRKIVTKKGSSGGLFGDGAKVRSLADQQNLQKRALKRGGGVAAIKRVGEEGYIGKKGSQK